MAAGGADFERVRAAFDAVCDLVGPEREARLAELCAGDPALRGEVERLLERDLATRDALGAPALAPVPSPATAPRIGGFEVVGTLGVGGMGVVYEARQARPGRSVALKVLRSGFVTPELLRRFEHEARILARLDHPGIAVVYEAGQVDSPQGPVPWLAMELVRGTRVDLHVREQGLGTRAVLELVARVAEAVHHAHQRGVVHRDLKPANLLVRADGQPKVLDFGIARITESDLEATAQHTVTGELLGTLPYMAPEQVRADPARIDARVDVYALGVVAYELLSGRRPLDVSSRALHEAARIVCEEEPTHLGERDRTLRGDVATIVHKALEKDRERRYATAGELADDLRRHLAHQPIRAVPPSRAYRARKFARRNRLALGAAAVVVLGLAVGLALALAGLSRAVAERDEKVAALEEANDVTSFFATMLERANPELGSRDVLLVDVIEDAGARIGEEFADRPLVEARLAFTIGKTLRALGRNTEALPPMRRAFELRREHLGPAAEATLAAQHSLSLVLRTLGDPEGLPLAEDGHARALEALGPEHVVTLNYRVHLGNFAKDAGDYRRAEELLRPALEALTRARGTEDAYAMDALNNLAITVALAGRTEEAEAFFLDLLERRRRADGEDHAATLGVLHNLATLYAMTGRPAEALALDERTLAAKRRVLGDEHPDTAGSMSAVAEGYSNLGRYEEASALFDAAARIRSRENGESSLATLGNRIGAAKNRSFAGDHEGAIAILEEVLALFEASYEPGHLHRLRAEGELGRILVLAGRPEEARALLEPSVGRFVAEHGSTHLATLKQRILLANAVREAGDPAAAVELLEAVIADGEAQGGLEDPLRGARLALAKTLLAPAVRDVERALALAAEAVEGAPERSPTELQVLARVHFEAGDAASAARLQEEVLGLLPAAGVDEAEAKAVLEGYRSAGAGASAAVGG